ncbi:MAG: thioredoxin-disulfide reductase [Holosporaceae bacterium]|jgi:thioredoxin reductase (NADPH)|nr:thioredoxin-disulfide reductase [Holosporaceae bacterium]
MDSNLNTSEILVMGSGPAGCTAAIYAARAGRKTSLITGPHQGGQLMITSIIENFPGFPEPVSGPVLMDCMRRQAENFGVQVLSDTIESVDFSNKKIKKCRGESGTSYEAAAIIVATGANARWLGVSGEITYRGAGVSACATCDGFFFKNKNVAVVGGGNTAAEEAIFLTNFAKSVTLIHRKDSLRAEKILQRRIFDNPKINILWNSVVVAIDGDGKKVTGLLLKNVQDNSKSSLPMDGVFIAIGHQPATDIFVGQLALDDDGYIITDGRKTSVDGVFGAGDVCDKIYRQAITSAGHGCSAALEADAFCIDINL